MFYRKLENIQLNNGLYLSRLHGKYMPNIILISDQPYKTTDAIPRNKDFEQKLYRLTSGENWIFNGQYRKNIKGNHIFDLTKTGHILIAVNWEGRDNPKGFRITIPEPIYEKLASSNGGGYGFTYYIFPDNIDFKLSEDLF